MLITGQIQSVIYQNDDNGYTVVKVFSNGEILTCVGQFPKVSEGLRVEIDGTLIKNAKYGEQISVQSVKILPPNNKEGIKKYLSSGLIKGIGPVTANLIVEKFGETTLDIIEFNPLKLVEVSGVSERKAIQIAETFRDIKQMQNSVMFLQKYDISTNMAVKIYKTYLENTEEILKSNPYKLVEDIDGIGFLTADKIAQKIGIARDSDFRFRAGILYALKQNSEKNGNTYITKELLKSEVVKLLNVENEEKVENTLQILLEECKIKEFVQEDIPCVMLTNYYFMENMSAQKIVRLKLDFDAEELDLSDDIKEYELVNNIDLHSKQSEAVKVAVNSGVSVITGGPGTGKTTIVKCLLSCFKKLNKKCILLAPTGRAAKRLSESTGEDASTIHRALELNFQTEEGSSIFARNEENPLTADVVIVDEVSMVDSQLLYNLLRAIKYGSQLVLVGDKDQLPSVGAGNVLGDILASQVVPVVELTQIYRQTDKSYIITNAHLINTGKMPVFDNSSKDFFFESRQTPEEILHTCITLVTMRLPKFCQTEPDKIQVLAPMKIGVCGVDNLNKELQKMINPARPNKAEIQLPYTTYRVGDKVMQTVNNYEQEWKRWLPEGFFEYGRGVFNGDSGKIANISSHTNEITVEFEDGRTSIYAKENINELMLSYAITIHKSQGSEFPVVVMPIISGTSTILTRNLLYTAVTRAKKMVVLVGQKKNVAMMVHNNYTVKRYSMLKQFLIDQFDKAKLLFEDK